MGARGSREASVLADHSTGNGCPSDPHLLHSLKPKPLAEAHHFVHLITELRVKRLRLRLVRHDLQIELRTSYGSERAFRMLDQRAGITVAACILGDRERIHPSAMPVITHHHRSDHTLVQYAD